MGKGSERRPEAETGLFAKNLDAVDWKNDVPVELPPRCPECKCRPCEGTDDDCPPGVLRHVGGEWIRFISYVGDPEHLVGQLDADDWKSATDRLTAENDAEKYAARVMDAERGQETAAAFARDYDARHPKLIVIDECSSVDDDDPWLVQ